MAQPDILFEEERISVVGGSGNERINGTERGDLEITTGKSDPASIKLNADWANLTLGGGAGKATEGDLKLRGRNGKLRVQVTAESGFRNAQSEDRIWVDGGESRIVLGEEQTDRVTLDGKAGKVELTANTGKTQASLEKTDLRLFQNTDRTDPGTVVAPLVTTDTKQTIRLNGVQARASIGNNFRSGTLELFRKSSDTSTFHQTVDVDAENARLTLGGAGRSGNIRLDGAHDKMTAELQGGNGALILGGSGTDGFVGLRDPNDNMAFINMLPRSDGPEHDMVFYSTGGERAMVIEPDGTVKVNGGAVESL